MLKKVDGTIIKIVFGFLILFLGVQMLLTSKKEKKSAIISKPVLAGISLVTGVLMGAYGIGVLLATVLAKITKDTKHFKSIFSTISALESTFRLIMYVTTGVLTL